MDRRNPNPVLVCKEWRAFCIGNIDEISNLLPVIRFLGKHHNVGFGEIAEWEIDEWNGKAIDTIVQNNRLIHALPEQAAVELGIKIDSPTSLIGWTPPQWKPTLFRMGWLAGTNISDLNQIKG